MYRLLNAQRHGTTHYGRQAVGTGNELPDRRSGRHGSAEIVQRSGAASLAQLALVIADAYDSFIKNVDAGVDYCLTFGDDVYNSCPDESSSGTWIGLLCSTSGLSCTDNIHNGERGMCGPEIFFVFTSYYQRI